MGKLKRIIFTLVILIFFFIALDFIPVKFAIKIDDAKKSLSDGCYICETNYVLPNVGWFANTNWNQHISNDLCVRVAGNSPDKILSEKEFDFKWFELYNKFLLYGKVKLYDKNTDTNAFLADLTVSKWEVIYPVKRKSFRNLYVPNNYLTIYDYNWIQVVKALFNE